MTVLAQAYGAIEHSDPGAGHRREVELRPRPGRPEVREHVGRAGARRLLPRRAEGNAASGRTTTPIDNDGMAALDFCAAESACTSRHHEDGQPHRRAQLRPGPSGPRRRACFHASRAAPAPRRSKTSSRRDRRIAGPEEAHDEPRQQVDLQQRARGNRTASLELTLAFYRRELAKLGWKEEAQGAIVKADRVALSFTTPDGPGDAHARPRRRQDHR